jgi:hypothetical protein
MQHVDPCHQLRLGLSSCEAYEQGAPAMLGCALS